LPSWRRAGLVAGAMPAATPLPALDGDASIERRARAYLHVNCAFCHTVDGPTPVAMDLRYTTALGATGLCGIEPQEGTLGVDSAERLVPGAPALSLLSLRMHMSGTEHMPPLGPQLVDSAGVALIDAWIKGLRRCQ